MYIRDRVKIAYREFNLFNRIMKEHHKLFPEGGRYRLKVTEGISSRLVQVQYNKGSVR